MANIAKLPDGFAVIDGTAEGTVLAYGPHLRVEHDLADRATLFESAPNRVLAILRRDGNVNVTFGDLNPITVPYVNRFIAGTTKVVIKDWRTGDYRLKSRSKGPKVRPTTTLKPLAQPVALPAQPKAVQHVTASAKAAVITVAGTDESVPNIPGMVRYPKVTAKGGGRGYTDVGGIIMPTEDFTTLEDAWHLAQDGETAAVLITGPAGTAKTMVVRSFAAYIGALYLKVDAGTIRSADDWGGAFRQDNNTKVWDHKWSPFAQALRAGHPCIIHVDELTRTETPAALNALMGLLDETGTMSVPDANAVLTFPKGILVVATANIGPEFVGTLPIDGAVRQRFPYGIRMAPPSESVETKILVARYGITEPVATSLVKLANQQREHRDDAQLYPSGAVISTRILLSIAKRIAKRGSNPRDAVISTLRAQFDPGDDAALSVIIDAHFPKKAVPSAPPETAAANIVVGRHWFHGTNVTCGYIHPDGTRCAKLATDKAIHFGN